ncbi:papain-like cysteine protease family protein [Sphingomonas sp. 22176]|uniref:papain-like cysteine protease family protein n=1 Tax=Sphingomonas sp. 22176 TaxID=3453884 RepID=UPI003F853784
MTDITDVYPTRRLALPPAAALGGAAPILLPFRVQRQGRRTQWCWAAVTATISGYPNPPHDAPVTMCQLATSELGLPCCNNPVPSACDVQNTLDGPLSRIGRLRAPIIASPLSPQDVANELSANLPLPIRVEWRGGGGHFVVIYGIRMVSNEVQLAITDPIYGESSISGAALIAWGYQAAGGTWTHSYLVTP